MRSPKAKKPKMGRPLMGRRPRVAISMSLADETYNYIAKESSKQKVAPGHIVDQLYNQSK